jgi:hypothetical protein
MPIPMSNNKGNVGVEGKDVRNATVATRLDSKGSLRKQARGNDLSKSVVAATCKSSQCLQVTVVA